MKTRLGQFVRLGLFLLVLTGAPVLTPVVAFAAPYAAMVIDARSGKVLHSRNADTQLHPASLTKMMTLYIAFEAIKNGEISLDTTVTIAAKAAAEPPSKLGLKTGQRIKLRYLIRAAAVKSANDAATAIGIAISGSEAAFARRMNRTAKALGMSRTHFKNAHGLTESGHVSTARDMTKLGRHLLFDYPDYYNLFSRRSTHAGVKQVSNTNRRFLDAYEGADGIKTGYTRAAGFNLVASAVRGRERIIATVFGGRSTASRNAKVAELLDLGFRRAPSRVAVRAPAAPAYTGEPARPGAAGKTIRLVTAVKTSPRPVPRPTAEPPEELLVALQESVTEAIAEVVQDEQVASAAAQAAAAAEAEAKAAAEAEALAEAAAAAEAEAQAIAVAAAEAEAEAAQENIEPAPQVAQTAAETEPEIVVVAAQTAQTAPAETAIIPPGARPAPRPETIVLATVAPAPAPQSPEPEIVTRISSSGGRHWGVNVGRYGSRYQAERVLLKTALKELGSLDEALRKVVQRSGGFDANFVGLSQEAAELACRRLNARNTDCKVIGPS